MFQCNNSFFVNRQIFEIQCDILYNKVVNHDFVYLCFSDFQYCCCTRSPNTVDEPESISMISRDDGEVASLIGNEYFI